MILSRRSLLAGLGLATLAGVSRAQVGAPPVTPSFEARVGALAAQHRRPLQFDGRRFSGAGWDHLATEAGGARTVLLGEDHGVAEIPVLAGQLFESLRPTGFSQVGIEISPPLARETDRLLRRGGVGALKAWFGRSRGVAFYTMAEEAAFLARVQAAAPGPAPVLFGLDYEVGGDRFIIDRLGAMAPGSSKAAWSALSRASAASWAEFDRTRNPGAVFTFSGDPELVRAVRRSWPAPSAEAVELMDALEETLAINRLQTTGEHWAAQDRRAAYNRANFARWRTANMQGGRAPKALLKFGASHMMRGRNTDGVHDIGSLAAEAAVLDGGRSFHLLVVPVSGEQAVFDPSAWRYKPAKAEMVLAPLVGVAPGGHAVLDLRPLRPLAGSVAPNARLAQFIHGFDAAVFLTNTTASANLL